MVALARIGADEFGAEAKHVPADRRSDAAGGDGMAVEGVSDSVGRQGSVNVIAVFEMLWASNRSDGGTSKRNGWHC